VSFSRWFIFSLALEISSARDLRLYSHRTNNEIPNQTSWWSKSTQPQAAPSLTSFRRLGWRRGWRWLCFWRLRTYRSTAIIGVQTTIAPWTGQIIAYLWIPKRTTTVTIFLTSTNIATSTPSRNDWSFIACLSNWSGEESVEYKKMIRNTMSGNKKVNQSTSHTSSQKSPCGDFCSDANHGFQSFWNARFVCHLCGDEKLCSC